MTARTPATVSLLCSIIAVFAACGDRVGEPIVAAEPELQTPGAGIGGGGGGSGPVTGGGVGGVGLAGGGLGGGAGEAAGSGGADSEPLDPFGGLCTRCTSNDDCSDLNDDCIQSSSGELFCGRDCQEWSGCPVGYDCYSIEGAAEPQCLPRTDTCIHLDFKPPPPAPSALRAEAIDFINDLRAERGLYALIQDDCLSQLAEDSAAELALTGDFLGKFERECLELPSCECDWGGESEMTMTTYDLRYDDIFEQPISSALAESPSDFSGTLFSDAFTRIGYGMVLTGDEGFGAYSLGF